MIPRAHAHLLEPIELALPLHAYRDAFPRGKGGFVLDGGDFALLGAEPFLAFRAFRSERRLASGALAARVVIEERGATVRAEVDDAFDVLRALLREHAVDPELLARAGLLAGRPIPLLGGAVGYLGYEVGQMLERLPSAPRPGVGMPDIALFFHDWVLGHCHRTGRSFLSIIGREDETTAHANAVRTRDRLVALLASFERDHERGHRRRAAASRARPTLPDAALLAASRCRPLTARADYLAAVRSSKEHIACGDAFEICLTHRLDGPFEGDPFDLWRELQRSNPAPFAAFLDLPEGAVVSSSPERFLALGPGGIAESRPIKGTRPRGATPEEDAARAADLATSIKDRAENAMIVDLVRNDLGRVCRFGTVEVPELYAVEHYATVHQLVSTVRGELDPDHDALDLVKACFPPGSMTGAPKIEAMTILEGLEPTERGVYSGALGWFDFSGTLELSVVIRTLVIKDRHAYLHVGGAIVADSDPATEHDETMHKARALLGALASFAPAPASDARAPKHAP